MKAWTERLGAGVVFAGMIALTLLFLHWSDYLTPRKAWPDWAVLTAVLIGILAYFVWPRPDHHRDSLLRYAVVIRRWQDVRRQLDQIEREAENELRALGDQPPWRGMRKETFDYLCGIIDRARPLLALVHELEPERDVRKLWPAIERLDRIIPTEQPKSQGVPWA